LFKSLPIYLILLWVALAACDSEDGSLDPALCPFHGITETDENNRIISVDPSDWCMDPSQPPDEPRFHLAPAFPNPASASVTIRYDVAYRSLVNLHIVSVGCDTVRTLVRGEKLAGSYAVGWDCRNDAGAMLPKGIYRCIMRADTFLCYGDIQFK